MAELEYGNRDNLFNRMKTVAKDGRMIEVANSLQERNDMIRDLPTYPANGGRTHQGARVESLPTPTISTLGGGWTASFGRLQPFVANTCIARARYQVPRDILRAEKNPDAYRTLQENLHVEGMSQGVANTLIYGNDAAAPEKIDGFCYMAPWNDLDNSDYVYDMGGSANLRSVWLLNINGPANVFMIYPDSEPNAGLSREDKGEVLVSASDTDANASGKRWDVITEFEWMFGLVVNDQRAVKRVCNIDWTLANMSTDLIRKILQARLLHEIGGTWFLYAESRIFTQLVIMAGDKLNVRYSEDNPYRVSLPMIGDIIIRRCDALRYISAGVEATEPAVTT